MRMPALIIIILLSSCCAHAAFRMPPAPLLHSSWCEPDTPFASVQDQLPSMASHARLTKRLIVAGGLSLMAGVPSLAYGYAHNNDQPRSGWYSLNSFQFIDVLIGFGIIAVITGVTMLVTGLAVKRHFHIDN